MKTKNNSIYEKNPLFKNPNLLDPPEKSNINKTARGEGVQSINYTNFHIFGLIIVSAC